MILLHYIIAMLSLLTEHTFISAIKKHLTTISFIILSTLLGLHLNTIQMNKYKITKYLNIN